MGNNGSPKIAELSASARRPSGRLVLLLVLLSVPTPAVAGYRFDAWTADNGLPQNIVTGIAQTRDGYIWIATLDGLARFDGVRFTVFDKNNTPGINTHRFTSLFEDADGDLWVSTEGGEVTRHRRGRFTTWTREHGVPAGEIIGFTQDEAGRLLVVSLDAFSRYDPERDRFGAVAAPTFAAGYRRLRWDERAGFWGVDETTLHRFDRGRWTTHLLPAGVRGTLVTAAAQAQDGTFWIEAADGRRIPLSDGSRATPRVAAARVGYQDRRGEAWSMEVHPALTRALALAKPEGVERVEFTVFFEDREGHIWLGTDGQGLRRVRPQVIVSYSRQQGLVDRNIYPIVQDRVGDIWIGAWNGGLSRFHDGRFISYTTRDGLRPGAVSALGNERDGVVWIATTGRAGVGIEHQRGLQVWRDGRFESVASDFLPDRTGVNVIHQDRAGAVWFGTSRGVVRYERGAATLLTAKDGLASDDVRVIIDRASGGLWIGGTED